ncbi:MAG: uroporphyrinogen-III decarboxylase-like protein [Phycisphaerae bacterium]|nr:uroporphyrinogen-III decarboxylase-like protein [Phycisphaerae bacterium]
MPAETMTSRERWLATLQRERPDRIPMDYWATDEASQRLVKHLGCRDLGQAMERLHVDLPHTVVGRYVGPMLAEDVDVFGICFVEAEYENGVYREAANHPLAGLDTIDAVEAGYTWPSPDWYDYGHIRAEINGRPTQPIRGGGSEPFLTYCQLRGLEQAFVDLIERPEYVEYCLGKLFDLAYADTQRIFDQAGYGNVQITYVAEDMGSQTGLLFSPAQIERFLVPGMRRMIELAHDAGAYVFHHNDGAIRRVIPTMIDAGIDVLNPIQWRCEGMDRAALKRDFGDHLVFHGGVDNQHTLPFATPDAVRQEVADNIRILGTEGGYILAPCHNIQAVSPPENIVAMYEAGYEYGWC